MRVIRHLSREPGRIERAVLTLGNFDGVHLGHQAIVRRAAETAARLGGSAVALTFHPHPLAVLAPERAPLLIHPLRERLARIAALGAAIIVVQRFTPAFAALDPEAFVRDFLLRHLEVAHVVVGYNVNFGRGRAGTVETLRALGARYGFAVDEVGPVTVDGARVSSTALRDALAAGDARRAARLRGRVVVGEQRGRALGFPTANLHCRAGFVLPADGVYAARVQVDGVARGGVVNVGMRPTFGERRRTVEAHLLDFSGDLYGRWVTVEMIERLRGERKFPDARALARAIAEDVARARALLDMS